MSARDDYPDLANCMFRDGSVRAELEAAFDEIDRLRECSTIFLPMTDEAIAGPEFFTDEEIADIKANIERLRAAAKDATPK